MKTKELLKVLRVYWKTIFMVLFPILMMPIFLMNNTPAMRCLYVVSIMSAFWVLEIMPLAITALMPVAFFPIMGILDTKTVCLAYMKPTNMMFIGGLILAIAVEHCHLHTRISLYVMKWIGCSPRKLSFGLVTVTMFISMWISNTAATAMMIPIVEATMNELTSQGIGKKYEDLEDDETEEDRRPTPHTMCMYISIAYAAGFGGLGSLLGTGTNLTLKGIYETAFPNSPEGIDFTKWMLFNVPLMLLFTFFSWVWLQIWFMGLFRPNSKDAKAIDMGVQGSEITRMVITRKMEELGKWTSHEISVAVIFIVAILLWFFRQPQFIKGWAELISDTKIGDATPVFVLIIIMFMLPNKWSCIHMFDEDESKRPDSTAEPLITWKVINAKMPWGLVFLLGGGFALADGSKASGMSNLIATNLKALTEYHSYIVMSVSTLTSVFITQLFSSNVAVANIILPVLADMSRIGKIHPLKMMLPATIGASFAFCLPVSTPPNGIAAGPINMSSWEMIKAGSGCVIIATIILLGLFPLYAPCIYSDINDFPAWAHE